MEIFRMDRTKLAVKKMTEVDNSSHFWKNETDNRRIEAIQFLRQQYHPELNDSTTRLQRVYRITQLEKS